MEKEDHVCFVFHILSRKGMKDSVVVGIVVVVAVDGNVHLGRIDCH